MKLVIEVDCRQHNEQIEADAVRTDTLAKAGFLILRFWNNEVLRELEDVKERIWMELQKTGEPILTPNPLLEGEGAKEVPQMKLS